MIGMVKQKKKRNKVYRGSGAAVTRPAVIKVSAVNRNRPQQWWFEKKRVVKPVAITVAIIIAVIWLIVELIRIINWG